MGIGIFVAIAVGGAIGAAVVTALIGRRLFSGQRVPVVPAIAGGAAVGGFLMQLALGHTLADAALGGLGIAVALPIGMLVGEMVGSTVSNVLR